MRATYTLPLLLILAAGLADLAVAVRLDASADTALMLFLGLAFGQLAVLAVWCLSGNRNGTLRLAATAMTGAILARPIAWSTAAPWSEWLAVLYLYTLTVGLLVAATRGLPDANPHFLAVAAGQSVGRRRFTWRFSLRTMFALMTTLALILGATRQVTIPWHALQPVVAYIACLALVAVAAVRAVSSGWHLAVRLLPLLLICLAGGCLMSQVEQADSPAFFASVTLIVATTIWLGLTALDQSRKSLLAKRSGT